MKNFIHIISHLIFWVWNLTFIGLIYVWLLPSFGFDLLQSTRDGTIDPTFTASLIALLLVPPICTLLGFVRLRKYPVLLMRLFYGVEAPLFALCLLRMFLIRELTVASGFVLAMVLLAVATFAIELLAGYSAYRPRLALAQMISHSLILLVGLYAGTLLLLYTIPAAAAMIVGFFQSLQYMGSPGSLFFNPIGTLFGFLSFASVLVFLTMPYVLVTFYMRAWARIRTAFGTQHSQPKSWAITGVTLAISTLIFVGLQGQPQVKAFSLLNATFSDPSASAIAPAPNPLTAAELTENRQTQLENATALKAGLTNAYLHNYRYLSPWANSNALADFYRYAFKLPESNILPFADGLQVIHNALLSPFLYRGENGDAAKAAKLYAQVFDEPIQKAESNSIRKALQATANRDETSAGVLNLDQKIVYLASQKVSVSEQGDWATVEIQEKYSNPTWEDQEIFYSFSLPESATITGLWLGDAASPKLFPFAVSPRGAAQKVYKNEVALGQVQEAVDPALLEQVGPRQYRLRVFPIPAATPVVRNPDVNSDSTTESDATPGPGELYLSMTYQVMQESGGWPLPQLTEKRSIYWDSETEHLRGKSTVGLSVDQWFEAALPAKKTKATIHTVDLTEDYTVTAAPLNATEKKLPNNKQLAVVIDSSYSMGEHTEALKEAIQQLKTAGDNRVDFYSAIPSPPPSQILAPTSDLDVSKVQFYGSLQPTDLLQQFAQAQTKHRPTKPYDGLILLTDQGSYELANDKAELPNITTPLWIVHVDGKLPSAYPDKLLQLLQTSKGGVETNITVALQQIALASSKTVAVDGYSWKVEPFQQQVAKPNEKEAEKDAFEAIAARQLIAQQSSSAPDLNKTLDGLHAIAKRTGIVTPYSSMIVLVDERQREELKKAEASADRFEREVEKGEDDLTEPNNPLSTSIPEPNQVLGLMVGAIALVLLKRKTTRA